MPQPRRASPSGAAQPGVRSQRIPRSGGRTAISTGGTMAALGGSTAGVAASGITTGTLTAVEVRAIIAATLTTLRRLSLLRRRGLVVWVADHYRQVRPSAMPAELRHAAREELGREVGFRRKQTVRVRRDMARALALPRAEDRVRRVQTILDRERRYSAQREEAAASRAAGAADAATVHALDPFAVVWELGPRTHHTPDCVYLHGRALSWEALRARRMIPPVHAGCGCRLRPRNEAWRMGLTRDLLPAPTFAESLALIDQARALAHGEVSGPLLEAEAAGAW